MELVDIIKRFNLTALVTDVDLSRTVNGVYVSDMLSDVMATIPRRCLWITHQVHENVIAIAYFRQLAGVIFVEDAQPQPEVIEKAKQKKINLFTTDKSAFEVAGKLWELGLRTPEAGVP